MNHQTPPSDESKNSFVDRELAAPERQAMQAMMLSDPALREDLCERNSLKELVREAYAVAGARGPARRESRHGGLRVAGLAIVCLTAGWIAHAGFSQRALEPGHSSTASVAGVLDRIPENAGRVLLHVSTRDPDDLRSVVAAAESLLARAQRDSQPVQVEVVANNGGLDLLRADVSPMAARIAELRSRYPSLTLVACNQTIGRLRERGESVTLLPGVTVASSALDEIVARMQKGWLYLRT